MTGSPTSILRLLALAAVVLVVMTAGCGGSSSGLREHHVPEYDVSLTLPASWDAVGRESSEEVLEEFQRAHPAYLGVAETFVEPIRKLLAAGPGGDVRLLLSIGEASSDYTLSRHIQENLRGLEGGQSGGVEVEIHGPREQIVQVAGGPAWRLRWSFKGDQGRIQVVQYTLVRGGHTYLFSYSTLTPWEEAALVFEESARSIRIGSSEVDEASTGESSASTGMIAFHREREGEKSDIYVVNAAGGGETRLTRTGADHSPSWSPDGQLLAFASARDGNDEIYVMRADGTGPRRLTTNPEPDSSPSWSPDGKRIMFTRGRSREDAHDLYVMNVEGTAVERLTRDGESGDGSWSPNGQRIVFWSGRNYGSGIFLMDAGGGNMRPLTAEFETAWGADWSPDGKTILFVGSRRDGDDVPSIWRMNADGSNVEELSEASGYWIDEPEWSPDGESIAFFSDGRGPGEIWVMDTDGGAQRPITHRGDSHSPSWQP